jgi:ATP-binding cassette subfamily B (MDR/TAP) protein 8
MSPTVHYFKRQKSILAIGCGLTIATTWVFYSKEQSISKLFVNTLYSEPGPEPSKVLELEIKNVEENLVVNDAAVAKKRESSDESTGLLDTCIALRPFLLEEWPYLILSIASSILYAALGVYIPIATTNVTRLICNFSWNEDILSISHPLVLFIASVSGQTLMLFLSMLSTNWYCDRVIHRIQYTLLGSLLMDRPISFFDQNSTGHLIHRLNNDPQELKHSLKILLSQGVRNIATLLGTIVQLALISPKWTIVLTSSLPAAISIGHVYGSILRDASKSYHYEQSLSTSRITQVFSHIRTVLAFLGESNELEHYDRSLNRIQGASDRLGYHMAIYHSSMQWAIQVFGVFGILLLASGSIDKEGTRHLSQVDLARFIAISQQAQWSLGQINGLYAQTIKALQSASRIFALMPKSIDIKKRVHDIDLKHGNLKGPKITLDQVSFSYPNRSELFDQLSMIIYPGETVAICGMSGSGKSTIASLLERFYDPKSGTIWINDSIPLNALDKRSLRKQIGYIPQEPVLFDDTIMDNIRYGASDISDDQVFKAAKQAHIHDFIMESLPDQYSTIVGEHGVALSGGQKQRIAIARAIVRDPAILILDEATSALDHESEYHVQTALKEIMTGRTVIIIAHRWNTIRHADRIIVMKHGRILEHGTLDELLSKRGFFYAMHSIQQ